MERYNWTLLRPLDPSTESDRLIAAALMAEHCVKERKLCGAKQQIQLLFTQLGSFKYEKAVDEEPSSLALLDELRLSQAWSQSGPFQMSSEDVGMILDAKTAPESRSSIPVSPPHDGKVARRIPHRMQHPCATILGRMLREFCKAPWPEDHKSLTWLDKVTESRKRLQNFWKAARGE